MRGVVPRGASRAAIPALICALALVAVTDALASWSAHGTGSGAGAAAVMLAGDAPTASVSGSSVIVSWPAATLSNGGAASGYTVQRTNASTGVVATIGANCSGTISATTCTEQDVPAGSWTYTDTPVVQNWSGPQSPVSNTVEVGA